MTQVAKLFKNGRGRAAGRPAADRFEGEEVYIRRDPATGDVILSTKPRSFDRLFAALAKGEPPDDFLSPGERRQEGPERDPFEGWEEQVPARRQRSGAVQGLDARLRPYTPPSISRFSL